MAGPATRPRTAEARALNSDIRIATLFPDCAKLRRLEGALGQTQGAGWCLLRLWVWAALNRPDGDLTGLSDLELAAICRWPGAPAELVSVLIQQRWIDERAGRRRIHDWGEHEPYVTHAEDRRRAAKIANDARWKAHRERKLVRGGVRRGVRSGRDTSDEDGVASADASGRAKRVVNAVLSPRASSTGSAGLSGSESGLPSPGSDSGSGSREKNGREEVSVGSARARERRRRTPPLGSGNGSGAGGRTRTAGSPAERLAAMDVAPDGFDPFEEGREHGPDRPPASRASDPTPPPKPLPPHLERWVRGDGPPEGEG